VQAVHTGTRPPRFSHRSPTIVALLVMGWVCCLVIAPFWGVASAQTTGSQPVFSIQAPPGLVGATRAAGPGPVANYFQPVEIRGPHGLQIAFADRNGFTEFHNLPVTVGLLVGRVYRLKVAGIPQAEGVELFPSLEVIDRLYPPPGQERHFPIIVELHPDDLRLATAAKYVTRVIYLEDPQQALPVAEGNSGQLWFEVRPDQDPLAVADALGRPLVIVRLGGRIPLPEEESDPAFLFGSPPLVVFPPKVKVLPGPPSRNSPATLPQPTPEGRRP